ncbi:hypothetical protein R6Q59_006427, partial [Mikania micrantha]
VLGVIKKLLGVIKKPLLPILNPALSFGAFLHYLTLPPRREPPCMEDTLAAILEELKLLLCPAKWAGWLGLGNGSERVRVKMGAGQNEF